MYPLLLSGDLRVSIQWSRAPRNTRTSKTARIHGNVSLFGLRWWWKSTSNFQGLFLHHLTSKLVSFWSSCICNAGMCILHPRELWLKIIILTSPMNPSMDKTFGVIPVMETKIKKSGGPPNSYQAFNLACWFNLELNCGDHYHIELHLGSQR